VRKPYQRTLKFVGDDADFVAAHVKKNVDSGVDADGVGRRDEFAISSEAHLVGAGDNPLSVGGSNIPAKPKDSRTEFGSSGDLARGVIGVELDGMSSFAKLRGPIIVAVEQAPVVGGADGVEQIEMRLWVRGKVDVSAMIVAARDNGGDTHVEIGARLRLAVHAREAINEAGDDRLSHEVDGSGCAGLGSNVIANRENPAIANNELRSHRIGRIHRVDLSIGECEGDSIVWLLWRCGNCCKLEATGNSEGGRRFQKLPAAEFIVRHFLHLLFFPAEYT